MGKGDRVKMRNRALARRGSFLLSLYPMKEGENMIGAIEFLRNLFYGDTWYIAWSVAALPLLVAGAVNLPALIKSFKGQKKSK